MMCWDAVTTACNGGPEWIAYYSILAAMLVPVDAWCMNGDGLPVWCGTYVVQQNWMEVAQSTSTCSILDLNDPPLGGVWFIDVEAVDTAGNSSLDRCP